MLDLNLAGPQHATASRVDMSALEQRLRDYADQWIPREFPQGLA
jgi:hypothetical protein